MASTGVASADLDASARLTVVDEGLLGPFECPFMLLLASETRDQVLFTWDAVPLSIRVVLGLVRGTSRATCQQPWWMPR